MLFLRLIILVMLVAGAACLAAYVITGKPVWRIRGLWLISWAVGIGMAFFAILLVIHLTDAF
jgi:uncharacterized membrane protein